MSAPGLSLHADVAVPARDRKRLERFARYVARPPLAAERLTKLDDGRLGYRLKHRWRDGTRHIVLEPVALLERLAVCILPPDSGMSGGDREPFRGAPQGDRAALGNSPASSTTPSLRGSHDLRKERAAKSQRDAPQKV